jgi:hypothetical protein
LPRAPGGSPAVTPPGFLLGCRRLDATVGRRLGFDLLESRHRAARPLGESEREGRRNVLAGDSVLLEVAVEVGWGEGGVVSNA